MGQSFGARVPLVLVVEDEVLIAEMVRETLVEYGYEVHAVTNAAEALSFLSDNRSVDVLF